MIDVPSNLIGWWDRVSPDPWEWSYITAARAEEKYGAAIYREGQRPAHLIPIFESENEEESC